MNFASDNAYGVLPQVWAALHAADQGTALAYGNDAATKNLTARFAEVFAREVAAFPVYTGTAANALALACLTPPFGAVLCHKDSHIMTSECGAPEFFSGAKLIGLDGANGKPVSENFYWQAAAAHPDDFTSLNQLPKVTLEAKGSRTVGVGSQTVTVTLHNPAKVVALMTHLQLRNAKGERILPVFASENYISLAPGETRTVTLTAAAGDYMDEGAVVVVDGWNVAVVPAKSAGVSIAPNEEADPAHWPATGLPYQTENLR